MSLESFKSRTLGGSYGNPRTGSYKGQCVSYARKYMEEELDIFTYPNGHAMAYYDNRIARKNFDKVSNPQNGDIVVYGAWRNNPYGHIGIYYNGQLLSQNYNVPLRVTIAPLNLVGNRLGYLRKKGSKGVISMAKAGLGTARIFAETILGRNRDRTHAGAYDADLNKNHVGKEITEQYIASLWTSQEAKNAANNRRRNENFYNQYAAAIGELSSRPTKAQLDKLVKDLAEAQASAVAAGEEVAKLKLEKTEDSKTLDEAGGLARSIADFFSKLIKRGQ